mmetsp:Transcript_5499/g.16396  ORF Transcript_5499/g.16396 Transcript_5499/m.16396 type:complete len:186 (-) Transcript_5499:162-719(-)
MVLLESRKWRLSEKEKPNRKRCLEWETRSVSWQEVHELVESIVEKIQSERFDTVLAITRGGAIPGTLLAGRLGIMDMKTATVFYYTDNGAPFCGLSAPAVLDFPAKEHLEGRRVLIVDDCWESGRTARMVRSRCEEAGAKTSLAVLHMEESHLGKPGAPEYLGTIKSSSWLHYPWETHRAMCHLN